MDIIIIIIASVLLTLLISGGISFFSKKKKVNAQSVLLLEKIKKVCKLVTVEGAFAEIYHYEDVKERFLKLVSSKKKALVVIEAKAFVGFDLAKVKIESDTARKTIILRHFPQPEVLSIETNLNYYDKQDGMFNKFEASDLTELNKEAKQHILNKVPESNLFEIAKREALESVLIMESIVATIGWKLDYSDLEIEAKEIKVLEK
ncbi:MAG: DUF4230 domain-containing protein [Flavobacteriaceae bacterium]